METNYTPGQILYIKPEYGEAYVSIITGTSPHHEGTMIHTCCDLTIHEYSENMYEGGITFARGNGTMLDVDTNFEEIRQAADCEKKMLFNALVRGFKEHNLGWDKHFTDSTYFDILDWLAWEFGVDLEDKDIQNAPIRDTMYEIQDYIWDALCKETGNYQACTDYVEPEMVNKQKFIEKTISYFTPILKTYCSGECVKELIDGFVNSMKK
jgi:hypothetical protein